MQATITYLLTEQAQRAQMAATGQPVARKQVKTVEITADQLPLLAMAEDGTPYLDISRSLEILSKAGENPANHAAALALTGWPRSFRPPLRPPLRRRPRPSARLAC